MRGISSTIAAWLPTRRRFDVLPGEIRPLGETGRASRPETSCTAATPDSGRSCWRQVSDQRSSDPSPAASAWSPHFSWSPSERRRQPCSSGDDGNPCSWIGGRRPADRRARKRRVRVDPESPSLPVARMAAARRDPQGPYRVAQDPGPRRADAPYAAERSRSAPSFAVSTAAVTASSSQPKRTSLRLPTGSREPRGKGRRDAIAGRDQHTTWRPEVGRRPVVVVAVNRTPRSPGGLRLRVAAERGQERQGSLRGPGRRDPRHRRGGRTAR